MTASCIGFVAPLTSAEAVVAAPMLEAVEAVVAGSGTDVRVIACDDGRDAARAVAAVEALLAEPGLLGIVGPKNSGSALAAAPLTRAAGVAMLLPCATADELTTPGGAIFRLCAADAATAAAAAGLAVELGVERLAVFADDTAYGRGLAQRVRTAADRAGMTVTESVDDTGAAFLAMGEVEQAVLMRQLRDGGYAGALMSAEGGPGAPVVDLAGPAAEGAWLLYPGTHVSGRSVYAAEAADAARVLLAAATGGVPAIAGGSFDGETGPIRFTASGERGGTTVTRYRVVDGAVQPLVA